MTMIIIKSNGFLIFNIFANVLGNDGYRNGGGGGGGNYGGSYGQNTNSGPDWWDEN